MTWLRLTQWIRLNRAGKSASSARKRGRCRPAVEPLEDRTVPAALLPATGVRSLDGTGNNSANPTWGSTNTQFLRIAPTAYGGDGLNSPAGANRPSAREVSNCVADQGGEDVLNNRQMSALVYAWGQFIDHDLDLTAGGSTEDFSVPVPTGDPSFDPNSTGTQVIPLMRSAFDATTGITTPRQQINQITAWLDGSMIYGSDATTAASLRTFSGGKMQTSTGNLLPVDADGNFVAGDIRANENPDLTSLQTLFVREHNRVADRIAANNPGLSDEAIYQRARAWVIAEIQVITYKEWLPALLGPGALDRYTGYNPNVNPGIANEFAAAAFRLGHSLVGNDIEFLGNNGQEVADEVELSDAFFNPSVIKENGIDPILKYLASDLSQEIDTQVVDGLRNFLFGPPGAGGLDLASLNIQRGRDHGLADYNSLREAVGLSRVTSFAQITSDAGLQPKLQSLYGSVDDIDAWVGLLAEDHVRGGSVGPTLRAILADQFERLRDGDRFWYQRAFTAKDVQTLSQTTLADVIRRNTETTNLQNNVFFFRVGIGGSVYADPNHNGRRDEREPGLAGRTVELIDADSGEVVATTQTDGRGRYHFDVDDSLELGKFRVHEVLPDGWQQTTPADRVIHLTRGDVFVQADIGNALARPLNPPGGGGPGPGSGIQMQLSPPPGSGTPKLTATANQQPGSGGTQGTTAAPLGPMSCPDQDGPAASGPTQQPSGTPGIDSLWALLGNLTDEHFRALGAGFMV